MCDAILEDDGGYVYTCKASHHEGGRWPAKAIRHRDGAWFVDSQGRRVAVEICWSDPVLA